MIAIIGLGNPGKKFEATRHNVGFMAIDAFAQENNFPEFELQKKYDALVSQKEKILLAKPQTFMNESGKTTDYFVQKEGINPDKLIVLYDDLDLPLGSFKISFDRGNGGHNGVKSIEEHLGSREFIRIRIGISRTLENGELVKPAVLGHFEPSELELLQKTAKTIYKAIGTILTEGKEKAMTAFN